MSKKVFMCGFSQESNSLNPVLTDLKTFSDFSPFWGRGNVPEKFCLPSANGMFETFTKEKLR